MIENILGLFSTSFLELVLKKVKDFVYPITEYNNADDNTKALIDMFYIQPIYYALLILYANNYMTYKEFSLEDIINSSLDDEDKIAMLNVIGAKINKNIVDLDVTSVNSLIQKIFFDVNTKIGDIVMVGKKYDYPINVQKNLYPTNSNELKDLIKTNYVDFFIYNQLDLILNAASFEYQTVNFEYIYSVLSELRPQTFSNSSLNVFLMNNTFVSDNISKTLNKGDVFEISLPSYLFSVEKLSVIGDGKAYLKDNNYKDFGSTDKPWVIVLEGPVTFNISYLTVQTNSEMINEILNNASSLYVNILTPHRIDVKLVVTSTVDSALFDPLKKWSSYSSFFNSLASVNKSLLAKSCYIQQVEVDVYINPFVKKTIIADITGINFNILGQLTGINSNNSLLRLKSVTDIKGNNVYSL